MRTTYLALQGEVVDSRWGLNDFGAGAIRRLFLFMDKVCPGDVPEKPPRQQRRLAAGPERIVPSKFLLLFYQFSYIIFYL
jgi:hypothetical protein